jgi:hypothetical protein
MNLKNFRGWWITLLSGDYFLIPFCKTFVLQTISRGDKSIVYCQA